MKLVLLLLLIFYYTGYSQTINPESIKKSPDYYWGEASDSDITTAGNKALSNLTQQIAVKVSDQYNRRVVETSDGLISVVKDVIETYSNATLRNVKTDHFTEGGRINMFKYIEKKEVEKVFDARKELVRDIYTSAEQFKNDGNFGEALKHYYFALILINSLPDNSVEYINKNLVISIPQEINSIIAGLKFELVSNKTRGNEQVIEFSVKGFNKPAAYLEFRFYEGKQEVPGDVKDGKCVLQLFGSSRDPEKLFFQIKYSFDESKGEINEVRELWDLVYKPRFKNQIEVSLMNTVPADTIQEQNGDTVSVVQSGSQIRNSYAARGTSGFTMQLNDKDNCPVLQKIADVTLPLLELMKKKDSTGISKYLDRDNFLKKKIADIMKNNSLVFTSTAVDGTVSKTAGGWEMRKADVIANYSKIKKQSLEYLVFDYDTAGKLYDVNFGISEMAYKHFRDNNRNLQDLKRQQVLIKFIEKYRTAYLDRDIATIDSLFSDNAVIIVGRTMPTRRLQPNEMYKYIPVGRQPDFERVKYTKNEYLKSLKNLFASGKDIFLGFSTLDINPKNDNNNVYGISMRQNFVSTGYADEGYLFLLVDFMNELLPQIYVRSWQPQEYDAPTLIQLSNFSVIGK